MIYLIFNYVHEVLLKRGIYVDTHYTIVIDDGYKACAYPAMKISNLSNCRLQASYEILFKNDHIILTKFLTNTHTNSSGPTDIVIEYLYADPGFPDNLINSLTF